MSTYLPLSELMEPGWAQAMRPVTSQIDRLLEGLRRDYPEGDGYLPAPENIFRAFTYPFDDVKVLIIGQDPYPTPGNAIGLSFAVAPEKPIPASLRNIFAEMSTDLDSPLPQSGDLTSWAEQGVCLLNRVLTVSVGAPGSHRQRGWQQVTSQAIEALAARNRPLVAILWGREAAGAAPLLGATPIITSPHPSPLSARRGFFGSRPFTRANELLKSMGADPIEWTSVLQPRRN